MSGPGRPGRHVIPANRARWIGAGILAFFTLLLFASAWLHDDAYITLRTVDNLLHGYGPTWNPAERVQAYTHPLWLGLTAAVIALTDEVYFTILALSMALSLLSVHLLVFRLARSVAVGCVGAGALLLSKSFVDYATSGLEDPLTRVLLAAFVGLQVSFPDRSPRRLGLLALVAALLVLCRPDMLLLVLPAVIVRLARDRTPRAFAATALGFAPLVLWGLFALVYYGSPLPNTAWAKLGMGVPRVGLVVQGGFYLLDALVFDPVTVLVIGLALVLAVRRPHPVATPLAVGTALYLAYVVWIGGDYMQGRFLGAPFYASVLGLALRPPSLVCPPPGEPWEGWWRPVQILVLATLLLLPRVVGPFFREPVSGFSIGDERRIYHPFTGLVYAFTDAPWPDHSWRFMGEEARGGPPVRSALSVGLLGFYAGPGVHIVDTAALADPLLARLPAAVSGTFIHPGVYPPPWRPGHGQRPIPEGYLESLEDDANRISDPDLARYYEVIRTVTRGPLWDGDRLRVVVELNLGRYDRWIDAYVERHRGPMPSRSDSA